MSREIEHQRGAKLLEQYEQEIRRLARQLVRDENEASDLASSIGLRLLTRPPDDSKSSAGMRAWLRTVGRNILRDDAVREGALKRRELREARGEAYQDPRVALAEFELFPLIHEAIEKLSATDRAIISLHYLEHVSVAEIAKRHELSTEAVHGRLKRGREKLRRFLEAKLGEDGKGWQEQCAVLLVAYGITSTSILEASGPPLLLRSWRLAAGLLVALGTVLVIAFSGFGSDDSALAAIEPVDESTVDATVASSSEGERASMTPPVVSVPDASRLQIRIRDADGGAFADVALRAIPLVRDAYRFECDVRSDAQGIAWLPRLPGDRVALFPDRAEGQVVRQSDGVIDLSIPRGVRVRGRVVGPKGSPVRARVFVSEGLVERDGYRVPETQAPLTGASFSFARRLIAVNRNGRFGVDEAQLQLRAQHAVETDVDGRFELDDVQSGRWLEVRSDAFAPSKPILVSGDAGDTVEFELQLDDPGGEISVQLLDESGAPVQGAIVGLGEERGSPVWNPSGRIARRHLPRRAVTDESGRAAFVGVTQGTHVVFARSPGYAVRVEEIDVESKATERVLRLDRGATIAGEVTYPQGSLEGATVEVVDFCSQPVPLAANGRFEWHGVRRQAATVRIVGAFGATEVTARGSFHRGEVVSLSHVITQSEVTGTVVDEFGAPASGVRVSLFDSRRLVGEVAPDEHGSFVFKVPDLIQMKLRVSDIRRPEVTLGLRTISKFDARDVQIEIDSALHEITGTLTSEELPLNELSVSAVRLQSEETPRWNVQVEPSGAFRLVALPEGLYEVCVEGPNGFAAFLGRVELSNGQGSPPILARFQETGELRLRASGFPEGRSRVRVVRADGETVTEVDVFHDVSSSVRLLAGSYTLHSCDPALYVSSKPIELRAGAVEEHVVDVIATPVQVRLGLPEPQSYPTTYDVRVTRAEGGAVAYRHTWTWTNAASFPRMIALPEGRYRFDVSTDDGRKAFAESELSLGEDESVMTRLTLTEIQSATSERQER